MRNELLSHKKAYFILILGLIVFTLAFLAAWPNRGYQRIVVGGLGLFYFLWGVMTHLHTAHITKRVLYEYASMALLATVLLLLITL